MSSLDCPVVVIDGSFASHLSTLVKDPVDGDPLWSASFLVKAPNAVIKVHYDYLTAGANIITTNTYQASATGFRKHLGLNDDESTQLIKKAVDLARTAIDLFTNDHTGCDKPLIAGSVGPYGAALNDGSEYTGSYIEGITMEELKDWHRPRIKALVESGVDLLAFETIPAQVEGEVLIDLIKEYPQQKAWLSFSCKDEKHTSKGELFSDAIQSCLTHNTGQLVAIGTNCVNPKFVTPLLKSVGKCELPFIVYPNSGEVYNSVTGWSGERNNKDIDSYVHQWLNMGVRFIGSCCRTYPKCIANICKEVSSWKNKCSC